MRLIEDVARLEVAMDDAQIVEDLQAVRDGPDQDEPDPQSRGPLMSGVLRLAVSIFSVTL